MNKVTVQVDGMMCGMCEAHICETIRRAFPNAKKVKASRTHREATFLCEDAVDELKLKQAIADTGYTAGEVTFAPYEKRGLFG